MCLSTDIPSTPIVFGFLDSDSNSWRRFLMIAPYRIDPAGLWYGGESACRDEMNLLQEDEETEAGCGVIVFVSV